MPNVASSADLAANFDAEVTLVGTYQVMDQGRHKIAYTNEDGSTGMTSKTVRVGLDGGGSVALWVRPADEMGLLDGKRVKAVGKLVGPTAAQPGAAAPDATPSLIQIKSVDAE